MLFHKVRRFSNSVGKQPVCVCIVYPYTVVRQGDKRIVTLKEGEPEGKHVVIVDDLVQTGGGDNVGP